MTCVLLAGCGGTGPAASPSAAAPRPIVISSTSTPGSLPSRSGPADANPTALTPYATSTVPAPTAAALQTTIAGNRVQIADFQFSPATTDVPLGTQITWTNLGPSNHTVTASDGSFDSGVIQRNGTFTFTPTKAGAYAYHCTIHPNMQAMLIVR